VSVLIQDWSSGAGVSNCFERSSRDTHTHDEARRIAAKLPKLLRRGLPD
jgi:hypothetical protein